MSFQKVTKSLCSAVLDLNECNPKATDGLGYIAGNVIPPDLSRCGQWRFFRNELDTEPKTVFPRKRTSCKQIDAIDLDGIGFETDAAF